MANSSKEYDSANRRVIVIKPNEFFSLKQLNLRQHRERLEDLKTNLTGSNASFISKVCNEVGTSTSQCPIYAKEDASYQHALKLSKYKYVMPHTHKIEVTPNKKYKRKVSIVENGLEKTKFVDFADLSRATSATTINETLAEKNTENEMVNIDNDISEEKIIELIDKKYGAAIEAQLFQENKVEEITTCLHVSTLSKTHPDSKIAQDTRAKLPSDIYEYRLREEEFLNQVDKEQDVSEEVKEARQHLASILILDSPDDGYKLFTREELKRVPEKIFESPIKPIIKEEVVPNKETLDYVKEPTQNSDLKDVIQFKNLKINFENNPSFFTSTVVHYSSNFNKNKEGNEAKVEAKNVKENDTNDFDFTLRELMNSTSISSTEDPKKSHTESEKQAKEIIFANEDAAIVKEIDEFIEEISIKNKVLIPKETSIVVDECREKFDHDYCLEHIQTNQNCSKIEEEIKTDKKNGEEIQKSVDGIIVDSSESSNICVDAARFEDVVKCIIKKNELFEEAKIKENGDKSEENIIEIQEETKKSDMLAKLILESEIYVETEDIDVTNSSSKSCNPNVDVSEQSLQKSVSDSQIKFHNFSEEFKTREQINADESAILIVKENGFLEPINADSNGLILESFSFYDQSQITSSHPNETQSGSEGARSEKSSSSEENTSSGEKQKAIDDEINRDEILKLIENVREFQYSGSADFRNDVKTRKENLKHLGRSLIDHFGILKKLYNKLKNDTVLAVKKLDQNVTADELSNLYDDLNFIKSIVGQNFVKQEKKKLKYKVISIKRKSTDQIKANSSTNKPITKKVFNKTIPRCVNKISNKLLRKMLFRMNKLLGIVEKNEMFLMNIRRKGCVSKLKEMIIKDVKGKNAFERELCSNTKQSNVAKCRKDGDKTEKEQNFELQSSNSKNNPNKSYCEITKALTVALKRSDNRTVENDIRNITEKKIEDIPSQEKSFIRLSFGNDEGNENSTKMNQLFKSPNMRTVKFNTDRKLQARDGKDLQAKENTLKKQEQSPRYPLRSRKTTNAEPSFNHTREYQKDKTEKVLPFDVNFSNVITLNKSEHRKFDYVLKNDNKPCVVLYQKENRLHKPIFENSDTQRQKKNFIGNLTQGNKAKEHCGTKSYETRSKAENIKDNTQRILRSRKI